MKCYVTLMSFPTHLVDVIVVVPFLPPTIPCQLKIDDYFRFKETYLYYRSGTLESVPEQNATSARKLRIYIEGNSSTTINENKVTSKV